MPTPELISSLRIVPNLLHPTDFQSNQGTMKGENAQQISPALPSFHVSRQFNFCFSWIIVS
jgi:hypothetical protein